MSIWTYGRITAILPNVEHTRIYIDINKCTYTRPSAPHSSRKIEIDCHYLTAYVT
jgi:hypothetical protein